MSRDGLTGLIGLIGVCYLATIRPGHDWGDDFALYIQHARNIAAGVPYAETGYIYNPHNSVVGPRSYPPGFPVLLAPVVGVFGLDLRPMKVLIVLCFVGVLLLVREVFRRDLPDRYTAALILVMGLSPYFWDFKDHVVSDIPFLLLTLLSLSFYQRAAETDRHRLAYAALAGVAAYAAFAIRVVGIVLIPTFLAHGLLRRRRVGQVSLVACGICVVLVGVQSALGAQDGSYLDTLTASATTIGNNAINYMRAGSDIWDNGYTELGRKAVFLLTAGLGAYGYVRSVRVSSTVTPLEVFPWLYALPVVVWPANQGTRFLIPLIPFYLYYCMLGLRDLELWQRRNVGLTACLLVIGITYAGKYSTLNYGPLPSGVATAESVALFDFVKRMTDRTDVFVFSKPRALALFTERRASAPFAPDDPCRLWQFLTEIEATYVITGPPGLPEAAYLDGFVSRFPAAFRRVFGNRHLEVYRIAALATPC